MTADLTEWQAAEAVGEKIIEAADRVLVMHKLVPGTKATLQFEMDDVWYEVTVRVKPHA